MLISQPRWIVHKDKDGKQDQTIFSLDVHDDRLATGGLDSTVKIWSVEPILDEAKESDPSCHKLLSTLGSHSGAVLCVRWSKDGRYLASSSDDTLVLIWQRDEYGAAGKVFGSSDVNHEAYKVVRRLAGHTSDCTTVAWSDDDAYLASGGLDGSVLVYDVRTFQCVRRLMHDGFVKGVVWDPVGEFLASQSDDKSVRVWRTRDWALEAAIEAPFEDAPTSSFSVRPSWSPDGGFLLLGNATNNGVFCSAVVDRYAWSSNVSLVGHDGVVEKTSFNPLIFLNDANEPATGKNLCALLSLASRSSISFWITSKSRPLLVLHDLFERDIADMSWSADGRRLFCSSTEGHVACIQFELDEYPALAPEGTQESYHASFGFEKPVRPALAPTSSFVQTPQPARPPSPQKVSTTANGKRRIQPSFIAPLQAETTYATPLEATTIVARAPPVPSAAQTAALEARLGRPAFGGAEGITTNGFDVPTTRAPPKPAETVTPRKRKAGNALLAGSNEEAGPSRLPPAQPRGSKSRAPGGGMAWTSVNAEELDPPQEWEPLSLDDIVLERPAVMSFASERAAGVEADEAERLEWRNYTGDDPTEVVQLSADKSSTTPLWLDYLPSKVVLGVINTSFAAVACTDSTVIVYSPAGRRLLPTLQLDAPCAHLDAAGAYLLAVTASGRLHVWNVITRSAVTDTLHLRSLLGVEDSEKLVSVTVRPNGTPIVTLSNAITFGFDASLRCWTRLSATAWNAKGSEAWETRARGRTMASTRGVVRHLEGTINDLLVGRAPGEDAMEEDDVQVEGDLVPRLGEGKEDFSAAVTLDHLEARLSAAISLGSAPEYKQFLTAYAQRIADEGFKAKGEELVRELLGPVYFKPGQTAAWNASILGMPKRELLRDVLGVFGKSTALKKLAQETNDLLRKVANEVEQA